MPETVQGPLLGEVITWDIHSLEVGHQAVIDALILADLDPKEVKELTPKSAFLRACRHLEGDRVIDQVNIHSELITFQFTSKSLSQSQMNYTYDCNVSLNKKTGDICCPGRPDLEEKARDLFTFAMNSRTSQDISRLVQGLFKKHADLFSINPRKGVAFFVPEQHRSFTEKVDSFLTTLGGELWRFPVPRGTTVGNVAVKDAVQRGLAATLETLEAAVHAWDDDTRPSTKEKLMALWNAAWKKTEVYADYLGSEMEQLQATAQEIKAKFQAKMEAPKEETTGEKNEP